MRKSINFFVQEEFFGELQVFRLNIDSKTFLNVILSDLCKLSLSQKKKKIKKIKTANSQLDIVVHFFERTL